VLNARCDRSSYLSAALGILGISLHMRSFCRLSQKAHAPYFMSHTFITQPSSTPRTVGSMRPSSLTAYVHHVRLYICLEALQVLLHTQRQLNSIVKTSNSLYILRFTRHFIYVYLRICTVPRLCRNSSYSICIYVSLFLIQHPRFPRTH
jgi:hypothetical protein